MKKVVKVLSVVLVLACISALFLACAPGNAEKAKAKMEKAGYVCVIETNVGDGADGYLSANKDEEFLVAVHYESSSKAKEEGKEAEEAKALLGDKAEVKVSGKWVIVGTPDAIKAFTK